MELGPEDVSLLERCPHFRGCYVQASMELGPEDMFLLERCPLSEGDVYSREHGSCSLRCPCLILLEDLHSLCVSSEGSTREHATTATLAAFLDSLHTAPPSRHVVVMGTTNRIEAVDPCLRRPGRFDREIEVTTPTAPERREVWVHCTNNSSPLPKLEI